MLEPSSYNKIITFIINTNNPIINFHFPLVSWLLDKGEEYSQVASIELRGNPKDYPFDVPGESYILEQVYVNGGMHSWQPENTSMDTTFKCITSILVGVGETYQIYAHEYNSSVALRDIFIKDENNPDQYTFTTTSGTSQKLMPNAEYELKIYYWDYDN